ncbi:MAG: HNH endonuclease [Blautia sp.]|nr:HNH endonuclease [Blautia sp.]
MRVDYECEICGKPGHRNYPQGKVPSYFFCSRECQNEWQKTQEDIVLRNKDPEFRKKVSAGLKHRKEVLGDDYHSPETKAKIGAATIEHWNNYDDETRNHMLDVLQENATVRRTYGPYDYAWKMLSKKMCGVGICHRCGSRENLHVHHIIPTREGGTRDPKNLVVLCNSCHKIVEHQQRLTYGIIPDWDVIQLLVRERLHCI